MLIKNAKQIDGKLFDIQINNGNLEKIGHNLVGSEVIDLEGKYYVSAGWIDGHAHAFNEFEFIGDEIDTIGVESGVTTLIDAGTVGVDNIENLIAANNNSLTDVYSLLNISKIGIIRQNELADLDNVNIEEFKMAVCKYPSIIKGIKARMSGSVVEGNGIKPLVLAKEIQSQTNLPLMVHIGNPNPDLDDILKLLGKGDILTHCFHNKKYNILDNSKVTQHLIHEAIDRGLYLDVGHGTSSFSYGLFKRAREKDIDCDVISTDIYRHNRIHGPVYDMKTTISKFLNLGVSHENIIEKITSKPADIYNLNDRGRIKIGLKADLTIYEIVNKDTKLIDSDGMELEADKSFEVKYVIKSGKLIQIGD